MNNKKLFLLVFAGLVGGFGYSLKEANNFINFPLYSTKSKLETKVDSLQDKKNYWIALKDSSELTDLANDFISDYNEQINSLEKSISAIENDSEYKRLRGKAGYIIGPWRNSSGGIKIIMGSLLMGLVGSTYSLIKDKRQKN